jgi:hypothetical protein
VEDKKKMPFIQILIEVKVEVKVVKLQFEVNTEVCMVDIINMEVNCMEVDEKKFKELEVMEAVVEIIVVNN